MRPGEEGFERTGVGKRVANRRGGWERKVVELVRRRWKPTGWMAPRASSWLPYECLVAFHGSLLLPSLWKERRCAPFVDSPQPFHPNPVKRRLNVARFRPFDILLYNVSPAICILLIDFRGLERRRGWRRKGGKTVKEDSGQILEKRHPFRF